MILMIYFAVISPLMLTKKMVDSDYSDCSHAESQGKRFTRHFFLAFMEKLGADIAIIQDDATPKDHHST